jgi:hypothetical protein
MEWIATNATTIIAFFAALVGSFSGALFKEQFSEWFYKKKRKREVRAHTTKEIVMFYNHLVQQVGLANLCRVMDRQREMLQIMRSQTADSKEQERIFDEQRKIVEFHNKLVEQDDQIFDRVSEKEGNIQALVIEASHYISGKKFQKLKKVMDDIRLSRMKSQMYIEIYDGPDYAKIIAFRTKEMQTLIDVMKKNKIEKMENLIEQVNEILR